MAIDITLLTPRILVEAVLEQFSDNNFMVNSITESVVALCKVVIISSRLCPLPRCQQCPMGV